MGIDEKPAHSSVYECRGVAFEQENGNDESNFNENEYKNIKASVSLFFLAMRKIKPLFIYLLMDILIPLLSWNYNVLHWAL